ncbi:HlyD family efflux transporter periplasmic adaptor subunit [Devosia chinhatensis]|uniref:HlyD family efflux transporter periplasmic adaptor subunit n=2 Tax=Devosia aurantiaca TaxID=2714858 RepID=A0A6M1SPG4_9HYPH|nr:HlyD family efflux transporter periplasmic adaptor subunit [Devosia aurantiaca]
MAGQNQNEDLNGTADAMPFNRLEVLEPALWQRLTDAQTVAEGSAAWLALQCRQIFGVNRGVVRVVRPNGFETLCNWPDNGAVFTDLLRTAELAATDQRAVARNSGETPSVAVPVIIDGQVTAVVALGIANGGRDDLRNAIRQLQWGVGWLRDALRQERGSADSLQLSQSRTTIDLMVTALEHERFSTAAMAVATDLAARFDCARVSIGFVRSGSAKIVAISHTAQFGKQMNLVRSIGAAMDEAIDQRSLVLFPGPADEPIATFAHADLSREHHGGQVLTVPLFVVDAFIGAIVFERGHGHDFSTEVIKLADIAGAALGPVLDEKRRNDRWLIIKIWESFFNQIKRLAGPGHITRKLVIAALLAIVAFFAVARDMYRVNADAQLEGSVRRAVVSPYDGYLRDATVRAGEVVTAGQPLAELDDRDLVLERLRWDTERQQHQIEYDQALAARQPATVNIARSQVDQAEAQISLIDEQIGRTRFVAPFDGLVISGDLSQRIGSTVSRGEVLYEIAPLSGYRVVMQVDERQIAQIDAGQTGEVLFGALPDQPFKIVVDKIIPIAQASEGRNMFRVEGHLIDTSERLRPGMVGVGKVDIGERSLIDIWTMPIFDWINLNLWRWLG